MSDETKTLDIVIRTKAELAGAKETEAQLKKVGEAAAGLELPAGQPRKQIDENGEKARVSLARPDEVKSVTGEGPTASSTTGPALAAIAGAVGAVGAVLRAVLGLTGKALRPLGEGNGELADKPKLVGDLDRKSATINNADSDRARSEPEDGKVNAAMTREAVGNTPLRQEPGVTAISRPAPVTERAQVDCTEAVKYVEKASNDMAAFLGVLKELGERTAGFAAKSASAYADFDKRITDAETKLEQIKSRQQGGYNQ